MYSPVADYIVAGKKAKVTVFLMRNMVSQPGKNQHSTEQHSPLTTKPQILLTGSCFKGGTARECGAQETQHISAVTLAVADNFAKGLLSTQICL